ncbi:hypothetical protein Tco_0464496 [Tanacetum coccineum]
MTLDIHNWSSSAHQEILKIVKDEIYPIVTQVDARVQNFKIQSLKEAAKFVRDFKSLANEADESLAKHKALEFEIERPLRAVVSQDIMSIVQNPIVVETSDLQTELECTKELFENCIIKKENEYAKLWNDWYKKCEECKYDKISYDKAYYDMQQKIEQLQAQLGDLKGKSKDTPCVSDTLDPLSQKLENENVELEFQVLNYATENAHLKTTYKNLFDSINVTQTQTKTIIDSLQEKLHNTIYENAKFRAQLFDKIARQVYSAFKSSCIENKDVEVKEHHRNLLFSKNKKDMSSECNNVKLAIRNDKSQVVCAIRPRPRSNTKNDMVHSAFKSSCIKNKDVEVEEHHRNLLFSKNKKDMSSECNNVKLAIRNDKSQVVCAMWCSKHMTGNLKLLINFVLKFLGIVRFGNDHIAAILGYGDLQWEKILITKVYFVEGWGPNLFSFRQFCDSDLEVAIRRNTCFVRNLEGVDLLKGNRTTNLYTINLHEMASASPICLMDRATSTKSWLWLSHPA